MNGGFQWSHVLVAVLIPLAILVYYLGNSRAQRLFGRGAEPRGRRMPQGSRIKIDPNFAAFVGRQLQRGHVTKIAEAGPQPIMIRGKITAADANLGGAPGRECVWRNRSGAPRDAAVAAEYISVADDTGRVTVENLALAEVVAPEEKTGVHWASSALYIGDTVEVIARFKPERVGDDPDPTRLVYGSMGGDGNLHVRVCERPPSSDLHPAPGAVSSVPQPPPPSATDAAIPQESPE